MIEKSSKYANLGFIFFTATLLSSCMEFVKNYFRILKEYDELNLQYNQSRCNSLKTTFTD